MLIEYGIFAAENFLPFVEAITDLDRVNVSFAALTMNKDIGLSASAYGLGAGTFFLPYAVFEVPSNLLLAQFCARRWIGRIMFTWGIMPGRWPSSAARQGSTWCVSCWGGGSRFLSRHDLLPDAVVPSGVSRSRHWLFHGGRDLCQWWKPVDGSRSVREYLSEILPGLADYPVKRVSELTPAA